MKSCCPLPVRGCTRREPEMEEVVRETIGVRIVHSRTSVRRPNGSLQKRGRLLARRHHGFWRVRRKIWKSSLWLSPITKWRSWLRRCLNGCVRLIRKWDPDSRLRPCGHRLVSADSSPLTVKGELEFNIVFPGLGCDMLFMVASIGSDGLLGTEAMHACLPHQLDLRTGQLWAEGRATLQFHQQRLIPEVEGLLMTVVVLPPDSEIVAPFSVSRGRLGPCDGRVWCGRGTHASRCFFVVG